MLLLLLLFAVGALALRQQQVISFDSGALQLAGDGATSILISSDDWPGVVRAGQDLATDFGRVTGNNLTLLHNASTATTIIAGTIDKSSLIDSMISEGKINISSIDGQWESFVTQLVYSPVDGVDAALVIAGSDKRGTIYGLYDVSEQIGVSPWYWWADVAVESQSSIYALNTTKVQKPPSIKYRGIFLNDEQPALNNWVVENYPNGEYGPGFGHKFYAHVFELLLRLRANYLWPAEWNSMFAVDDPESPPLADEYGIVMGSSHTEPLMRWTKEQSLFLNGTWSWSSNQENVTDFLRIGVERSHMYENMYTMGMRGLGDTASPTLNATSLGQIISVEQELLAEYFGSNISAVPQMWCLYKEVGGYFQDGLTVPEDITLLWADDNWGNAQRLPLSNETDRAAGAGLYYHFDYVGDPRDYKWINTVSLQKTWQQLKMTYDHDARQIWVVNVGDLKPLELPINYFFDMAYDISLFETPDTTSTWLQSWATREFGADSATEVAEILMTYSMLAARRKYELLNPAVYSIIDYDEADNVLASWKNITERAQSIYDSLDASHQPSFFEIVLHPCKAGSTVYQIYITAAKNSLYASQGRTVANYLVEDSLDLLGQDHALTTEYHSLLDGKWNHMMDQTHLGYAYWQQPMRNTLPPLSYVQNVVPSLAGEFGVSAEGSNGSVTGDNMYNVGLSNWTLVVPPMDPYGPETRWIEIYSRGTYEFEWEVSPLNSWVIATPSSGTLSASKNNTDTRAYLSIDWSAAPEGSNIAFVNVTVADDNYGSYSMPSIHIPVNKTSVPDSFSGFVESDATVSIEAEHFVNSDETTSETYVTIPSFGRTLSGVTLANFTSESLTAPEAANLTYPIYFFSQNISANVTVYLGPALNTDPSRPLTYAISLSPTSSSSNETTAIQTVQPVPSTKLGTLPSIWTQMVSDSIVLSTTVFNVTEAGAYELVLWALEPGVIFEKVVVDLGGVRDSYLGPPESMRVNLAG